MSLATDISADGKRVSLMSSSDRPGIPDGGACEPAIWPHSNEAAGWTRPCEQLAFFPPPVEGPGGLTGFGYLPGVNPPHFESLARGISPDGQVVVGHSNYKPDNNMMAVVISRNGMQGLAVLDSGCTAFDVSQAGSMPSFPTDPLMQGRIIVGNSNVNNQNAAKLPGARAVYWDAWDHVVALPIPDMLPNDSIVISSDAVSVSDDGKIIAGNLFYNKRAAATFYMSFPCVWKYDPLNRNGSAYEILCVLQDLPGGDDNAGVRNISGDGKVVAGCGSEIAADPACSGFLTSACLWKLTFIDDENVVCSLPIELLNLDGFNSSSANGSNFDGSVIVGSAYSITGPCNNQAFDDRPLIWHDMNGMPADISLLIGQLVPDGWLLYEAMRVSADGRTVIGYGFDPDYNLIAWVAGLPDTHVPLNNWAVFVGLGLMIFATGLIYLKMTGRS